MIPTLVIQPARAVAIALAVVAVAACAPAQEDIPRQEDMPPQAEDDTGAVDSPASPGDDVARADTPGAAGAGADPPDADSLLPALPGYTTDDDAEPGEVMASLDHGAVPYHDVRRRVILDDDGFTRAEVTVVTFLPGTGTGAGEGVLRHMHADVPRDTTTIAGATVVRLESEPFATLAWVGEGFVVLFRRGAESSDAWLRELVGATVRQSRQPGSPQTRG